MILAVASFSHFSPGNLATVGACPLVHGVSWVGLSLQARIIPGRVDGFCGPDCRTLAPAARQGKQLSATHKAETCGDCGDAGQDDVWPCVPSCRLTFSLEQQADKGRQYSVHVTVQQRGARLHAATANNTSLPPQGAGTVTSTRVACGMWRT